MNLSSIRMRVRPVWRRKCRIWPRLDTATGKLCLLQSVQIHRGHGVELLTLWTEIPFPIQPVTSGTQRGEIDAHLLHFNLREFPSIDKDSCRATRGIGFQIPWKRFLFLIKPNSFSEDTRPKRSYFLRDDFPLGGSPSRPHKPDISSNQ